MFILFSNGVGLDNGEVRTGNVMIIDPYGRIIAETDAFEDTLVCATLDLSLLTMSTGRRWIHGRRPELYAILSQNQGYERDARSARFSTEVPQFSDNAALIRRQKEKAPCKNRGLRLTTPGSYSRSIIYSTCKQLTENKFMKL
jgi:hypothetical protein